MKIEIMTVGDIKYEFNGNFLIFMKYVGAPKMGMMEEIDTIIIPNSINGRTISQISSEILDQSFLENVHVKKLVIPKGITDIKYEAFKYLNADEVVWAESCTTIPSHCFQLSSIKKISNIQDVEVVENGAFFECSNLKTITWPDKCKIIPRNCFRGCENLKDFQFKNITTINAAAFYGTGLKTVTLTSKIKIVEGSAFSKCKDLEEITLPSTFNSIPHGCFADSYNLKKFEFKNIEFIGDLAFWGTGLQTVAGTSKIKKIGKHAFGECINLKEFEWPENCQVIPESCFAYSGIQKIYNMKKMNKIKKNAFLNCPIKTLDLRETIMFNTGITIDDRAFNNINDIVFLI